MIRGYFGIGIYEPKFSDNVGTLWRHALIYGASFIFTIGHKYSKQPSDTCNADKHIPLHHYADYKDFLDHMPSRISIVCVEQAEGSISLPVYSHPERAVYLLGSENKGLPAAVLTDHEIVEVPCAKPISMNVATAGTLIMYDRFIKHE